jgi:hypothetical protein
VVGSETRSVVAIPPLIATLSSARSEANCSHLLRGRRESVFGPAAA